MSKLYKELSLLGVEFYNDYPLAPHSSFKIGGAADIAVFPKDIDELRDSVLLFRSLGIKYAVFGSASNVLFSDKGYRGAVIFTKNISSVDVLDDGDATVFKVGCGVSLSALANKAAKMGRSGFEFLHGIPGSVGGAVYMNAGAFGSEISDVIVSVLAYNTETDETITLSGEDCIFSYRHSIFQHHSSLICVEAQMIARQANADEILARMKEYKDKRMSTQPYSEASAGSFFKRPEGLFAAKLIDDCGLKGERVGGACVSQKHAGFIVNLGGATACDVLALAERVRKTVYEKYGVLLEMEVRYIEE